MIEIPEGLRPRATYSQAQQDVILQEIFAKVGTTNKFCVEFGFNTTDLTGGSGSNTARLILEDGWTGVLFDSAYENPEINLHKVTITPENIGPVFLQYDVPLQPDYVSIDVDSIDFWLMEAMLKFGFRPRVLSVEYNSNFLLSESLTVKPGTLWGGDSCYGASLRALWRLGQSFKYTLVDVEPRLDLFFVRNNVWPDIQKPLIYFEPYTNLANHPKATQKRITSVMQEYGW